MSTTSVSELVLAPIVYASGLLLHRVRARRLFERPLIRRALRAAKVFPIVQHYYEPLPDFSRIDELETGPRQLPGIDLELGKQTELLAQLGQLNCSQELCRLVEEQVLPPAGGSFGPGDFEVLYSMIRKFKPRRFIEIGCGSSTRVAQAAIAANRRESPSRACEHVCIEPYEAQWLDELDVELHRRPVEELPMSLFERLEENDILFIDSSHVIRPGGDVLFEYLALIPSLVPGVIVHLHDIFTPRPYPREWTAGSVRLWNEQYLLEAFLSCNDKWETLVALNHLKHSRFEDLARVCPFLRSEHEPGSFYMRRRASTECAESSHQAALLQN